MKPDAPQARLGVYTLSALVAANMIGAGVFTTSGYALADLGSGSRVMWAWLCGAIIAICGALSYGGLSRAIAGSGGEYLYLSRILHPLAGFLAGWVSLLAGFTGAIAFAALALESYLRPWLPDLPSHSVAIAAVVFAGVIHGVRLGPGVRSQNLLVALKLALVVVFVVATAYFALSGLPNDDARLGTLDASDAASAPSALPFSLLAFAGSLVWISLSYSGFNAAVYVAGEAKNAPRSVPRAMLLATLGVSAIYLVLNAIFVLLAPEDAVRGHGDVAAAAAQAIGGDTLAFGVRVIISLALMSSVSSMMMAGPRVYARMADDGLFPQLFRFGAEVPRSAIALQGGLAVMVIAVSNLRGLLSYLGLTLSLCAAATVASLFVLRRREGRDAIHVPGFPWVPGFYVGATVGLALLAARRSPWELAASVATLLSGCLAYIVLRRWAERRSA